MVGSTLAHATIVGLLTVVPLLYFAEELPKPPDMLAFVVASAPPPPPPAPPAAAQQRAEAIKPKAVPKTESAKVAMASPVEAPAEILPERPVERLEPEFTEGGVEGGVVGGISGGIVGGIPIMPAPPPPMPMKPIRIGGDIEQPTLIHRVSPEYPQIAISAKREGIVLLEATVNADGLVTDVRVLRSGTASRQGGARCGQAMALFAIAAQWAGPAVHPHRHCRF